MNIPVQITFHGMDTSEALRADIEKHAAALQHFSPSLMACRVVLERSERHHRQGNRYRVHVHLQVPGRDIQAGRGPARENHSFEDPYVAIRDVFAAARRQLEDHERTRRGDIKSHTVPTHGQVAQLYKHADYGVIRTPEGREIHFHRHSVAGDAFDSLEEGSRVRFTEVPGEEGPWASTVHVVGKHYPAG